MADLQISLAGLAILHHDGSHVGEAAGGQAHGGAAHEHAGHDQQVGVRVGHALAHALHQRQEDECRHRVRDEGRDHQNDGRERHQHPVQRQVLHARRDVLRQRVQQARRADGLAERQAARRQDDDGPQEVVEVLFGEDAGAEEEHQWDDGDDAHVAEDVRQLVRYAPQADCGKRHDADEPLDASETLFHPSNRYN